MKFIDNELQERLLNFYKGQGKLTVLTGAGLSADSGIPTFRDKDGFWTVGSVNYMPEEMGTYKMFLKQPLDVWKWFLYRLGICSKANPNVGHYAIKELEDLFGSRFQLITQNVDGLHFKAGSARDAAYLIHGTLEYSRCGEGCSDDLYPYPNLPMEKGDELTPEQIETLKCPVCRSYLRPHVLWFDEYYNEMYYKLDSSLRAAKQTGLLLVVGTSGSTNLPVRIATQVLNSGGFIIDINKHPNHFSDMASDKMYGYALKGSSSDILPEFVELFKGFTKTI
ncbi:Sir2 family NAD-dependent protein deacetylase [Chitinophaga niabensis]|uniref:SIR2 family NAD-dependent protein deacylase n=1 Tax=Chitinophaga niabensis TaxID=536979 RepID=UPI0031B9F244